ncbi:VOC domain-containing protein [Balamuthia mandrillaris]
MEEEGSPPPPRILLDHISCAVNDLSKAGELLEGRWGGIPHDADRAPTFDFAQWKFGNGAKLEVITPHSELSAEEYERNFVVRYLRSKGGPRVHHVTFKVPCLEKAVARAEALGYKVVGVRTDIPSWKEAFLYPQQRGLGVVIQLAESHPELDYGYVPLAYFKKHKIDYSAERPKHGIAVKALHTVAWMLPDARKLWSTLLGGQEEHLTSTNAKHNNNCVAYRWPDSPIRVVVWLKEDEAVPEGPLFIEIAPLYEENESSCDVAYALLDGGMEGSTSNTLGACFAWSNALPLVPPSLTPFSSCSSFRSSSHFVSSL